MIAEVVTITCATSFAAEFLRLGVEQHVFDLPILGLGAPTKAVQVDYPGGLSQITLIYEMLHVYQSS